MVALAGRGAAGADALDYARALGLDVGQGLGDALLLQDPGQLGEDGVAPVPAAMSLKPAAWASMRAV